MNKNKSGLTKKVLKSAFNLPRWIAWDQMAANTDLLRKLFKNAFTKPNSSGPTAHETFEQATQRLHLSEADIVDRLHKFKTYSLIYLGLALLLGVYVCYLFWTGSTVAGFLSLILTIFLLVNAYSMSVYFIQTKYRKLGITFKGWLHLILSSMVKK